MGSVGRVLIRSLRATEKATIKATTTTTTTATTTNNNSKKRKKGQKKKKEKKRKWCVKRMLLYQHGSGVGLSTDLQHRWVSRAFASSSCPGRNYHGPSSPGEAACEPGALCALIHSTWTAPRGLGRATVAQPITAPVAQSKRPIGAADTYDPPRYKVTGSRFRGRPVPHKNPPPRHGHVSVS